jgi:uncharacterized protein (TIGR00297 family)
VFSETRRQIIHVAMVAFALLLRVLTWWQAALCAVAALAFNALVLPRLAGTSLSRPVDKARGYVLGILLYPLAVLVLILAFPARPDIAAAAWGILACGDGAATLIGRAWGRHALPWHPGKSVEGTAAFVMAAAPAGVLLAWWTAPAVTPPPTLWFVVGAPVVAALCAALAETLPIELDDNITVPAVAASVLWGLSQIDATALTAAREIVSANLVLALAVNTAAALGGWRAGAVRTSGMLVGWAIGVVVYACTGWQGWLLLFATFLTATLSSRLGLKRKAVLGIAEERGGRRGGGNAFANTGLAAIAAALAVCTPHREAALLAFVTVLVTGSSDTVASEIGKAWGGKTYLVTTWKHVRAGTPGAMSLEGTAAGLIAAIVLAWVGAALGLVPGAWIWLAVAGALVGSLLESALAATLEGPGVVNNDVLNFLNTAAAAIVAIVLTGVS